MDIRVTALTAEQTRSLSAKVPEIVVSAKGTVAVLNRSAEECVPIIQTVLDEIRETTGARDTHYRALVSVRNKLETAAGNKGGVSEHVKVIPNGTNVQRDIPPILAGKLMETEPPAPAVKSRRRATVKPAAEKRTEVTEPPAPTVAPTPDPQGPSEAVRANWEYMWRTSPAGSNAERFWARKLGKVEVNA